MKRISGIGKFIIAIAAIMAVMTVLLLFIRTKQEQNSSYITIDPDSMKLVQLEPPKTGDPIAVVNTTIGEFRFVLYPQYSPEAVKNFVDLANSGYYDNTYVFNSESGAFSAAGSKNKNGTMPENYDKSKELIPRELNQDLWPFRGAVCSMNTTVDRTFKERIFGGGTYFNGSRFLLVDSIEMDEETKNQLLDSSANKELGQAFIDNGGIPNFSQQMTVIGQTYEGLDVIEALAELETDNNGEYKIPVDDVMILSVEISEFSPEDVKNTEK